jgi:hypothetical protein
MNEKEYREFLDAKTHVGCDHGFEPLFMPDMLFPFQRALVNGRKAIGIELKHAYFKQAVKNLADVKRENAVEELDFGTVTEQA